MQLDLEMATRLSSVYIALPSPMCLALFSSGLVHAPVLANLAMGNSILIHYPKIQMLQLPRDWSGCIFCGEPHASIHRLSRLKDRTGTSSYFLISAY